MKTEGFYKHCALAGFVAMEDGEKVIYVYAGHSRLLAVDLANSRTSWFRYQLTRSRLA
jgi:hypothetical protein